MLEAEKVLAIPKERKISILRKQIGKRVEKILDSAIILAAARSEEVISACIDKPWYLEIWDLKQFIELHWYEIIEAKFDRAEEEWCWISVRFKQALIK